MLKKFWLILGPVIIALVAIIGIVFLNDAHPTVSYQKELTASTALTPQVFKSATLKQAALSDKEHRFVPFFGSSEWNRMDEMHPSVLAEGYQRSYRPFLLGQKGATSLTQFFGMQQMTKQMQGKQAVFVISPQWFTLQGANPDAFTYYFGTAQGLKFLQNQTGSQADKVAARRFLQVMPKSNVKAMMKRVAKGQDLTQFDQQKIQLQLNMLEHEDAFFSTWLTNDNYTKRVKPKADALPQPYNREALTQRATKLARQETNTNPFSIQNSFFIKRIKGHERKLANSQVHFSYLQSPEYTDFQLVLNQFAKTNTNVLFIIPPVNQKWAAYTGLNEDMYAQTVAKIRYQLEQQGFNHIADLSKDGGHPYFMQDTIHMGWNGWLAVDDYVDPFLTKPQPKPHYRINNDFLSRQWANYLPKK